LHGEGCITFSFASESLLILFYQLNDLIFCEVVTAVEEEVKLENNPLLDTGSDDTVNLDTEFSWNQLFNH
jgi:hypothetical protein